MCFYVISLPFITKCDRWIKYTDNQPGERALSHTNQNKALENMGVVPKSLFRIMKSDYLCRLSYEMKANISFFLVAKGGSILYLELKIEAT